MILLVSKNIIQNSSLILIIQNLRVSGTGLHEKNGSPVYSGGHEQIGTWLTVVQMASTPHVPGHGSTHLKPIQANGKPQSEFDSHSRLQPL